MSAAVTRNQLEMLRHAYGADSREPGYRSHYCTRLDDEAMVDMVKQGLFANPVGIGIVGKGHGIFHITEKGIAFCGKTTPIT